MSLNIKDEAWIGATDRKIDDWKYGKAIEWKWLDGSVWNYTRIFNHAYSWGDSYPCLYVDKWGYQWHSFAKCTDRLHFICVYKNRLRSSASLLFTYDVNKCSFISFQVTYNYLLSSASLMKFMTGKKVSGFRLGWFLVDLDGLRLTDLISIPVYKEGILVDMVGIASDKSKNGVAFGDSIDEITDIKQNMIITGDIDYTLMCHLDQIQRKHVKYLYSILQTTLNYDNVNPEISDQAILRGFKMYMNFVNCPIETLKLYSFLNSLILSANPQSIIHATVKTIDADKIKETRNRENVGEFYRALEDLFSLQFGKILVALSSRNQIVDMIETDVPYITKYREHLSQCIQGESCQLMESLGNNIYSTVLHLLQLKFCFYL